MSEKFESPKDRKFDRDGSDYSPLGAHTYAFVLGSYTGRIAAGLFLFVGILQSIFGTEAEVNRSYIAGLGSKKSKEVFAWSWFSTLPDL